MKRAISIFLFCVLVIGCDEAEVQPGELGGACRIGAEPCQADLVCTDGSCQEIDLADERPELEVEFTPFSTRTLRANGEDELAFSMRVTDRETGMPYVGALLLSPNPTTAGFVSPAQVRFEPDFQGLAGATYRACREGGVDECPEYVSIQVALPSDPLRPIARSEVIQLTRAPQDPDEMVQEPVQCGVAGGVLRIASDDEGFSERTVEFNQDVLVLDEMLGLVRINADGVTVSMRLDLADSQLGRRALGPQDVQVIASDSFGLPAPCGVSALAPWRGAINLSELTEDDRGQLSSVAVSFDVACAADSGATAQLTGCAKFMSSDDMN